MDSPDRKRAQVDGTQTSQAVETASKVSETPQPRSKKITFRVPLPKVISPDNRDEIVDQVKINQINYADTTPVEDLTEQDWWAIGLLAAQHNQDIFSPLTDKEIIDLHLAGYLYKHCPLPGLALYIDTYRNYCLQVLEAEVKDNDILHG